MHADDIAIDDWLGPVELDDRQRVRFISVWEDVTAHWPAPEDQDLRNAALSAAVQYLLGETTPTDVGREIARLAAERQCAKAAARTIAGLAVEDGSSERQLHKELSVTRRTMRLWLGKTS